MTENHGAVQNPTPARAAAVILALTAYVAFTLTTEQTEHVPAILGVSGAPCPRAAALVLPLWGAEWTGTKLRWGLAVDEAERGVLLALAGECPTSAGVYETAP
ncbi:hypothetical protein [Streptomyces arboris]|uniref:hypothetical protein n=1 Tax=Streptomyces arboris TaxID=2600619 RepID=UPI003C2B2857